MKLFANPNVWNKSIIEFAPAGVSFSIITSGPSAIRQRNETSAVKFHRLPGESAAEACERQAEKSTLRIAINCADQTDVVTAYVEKKCSRHQVGVAHVIVFVFVETFEPETVSHRILLVVMTKLLGDVFTGQTVRQQIGNVIRRVRTKIQTRTVEWIDETGGVTDCGPAVAANFFAVIWQHRQSMH